MPTKYKSIRVTVGIIAIIMIFTGVLDLVLGPSPDSRFYFLDNIFLRVIGVMLILSAIGLIQRKEAARKSIITLCIASILEMLLTYNPVNMESDEVAVTGVITLIIFFIPIIFLLMPSVSSYFKGAGCGYNNGINDYECRLEEEIKLRNSGIGLASFIVSLASIILFIISIIVTSSLNIYPGVESNRIFPSRTIVFFIGVLFIINFAGSVLGSILGLTGIFTKDKKKTLAIWGLALSLFMVLIYIIFLTIGLSYMNKPQWQKQNTEIIYRSDKLIPINKEGS